MHNVICIRKEFSKKVKKGHRYAGPYTKVRLRKCNNCGNNFWSPGTIGRTWCKDECYLQIKRKKSYFESDIGFFTGCKNAIYY